MNTTKRMHITVEDHQGKPQSGIYVSHTKMGRDGLLSNVVLERANGSRFRIVCPTLELQLTLGGDEDVA